MKVQKNIEVWLVKKRLPRPIDLVQYDTGIQLVFAVQDFTIPGGTTATLYVQKPSGKFVYQETGITVSGNTITIDLENQAITEHGNDVPYQVTMKNGTDMITTFAGIMRVEKSLKDAGATESKSVIAAFEAKTAEQIAEIEAAAQAQIEVIQNLYTTYATKTEAANAIKGNLSGAVVFADDVSPVEHNPAVWVHGKNLLDGELLNGVFLSNSFSLDAENGLVFKSIKANLRPGTYTVSFSKKVNIVRSIIDGVYAIVGYVGVTQHTFTVTTTGNVGFTFRDSTSISTEWDDSASVQIEQGETATEYTPYIDPSTVTVKRCGRNMVTYPYNEMSKTRQGVTFTVADDGRITANGTSTGAYLLLVTAADKALYLHKDQTYFFSCVPSGGGYDTYYAYVAEEDGETFFDHGNGVKVVPTKSGYASITVVVKDGITASNVLFKPMLEVGEAATAFEPYNGAEYTPEADGTVSDMTSLSPNMTILTDTEGVIVECEYNRDTNKALENAGGAVSEEDIQNAVNAYLAENPVTGGATAEQAAQIEANKTAIANTYTKTQTDARINELVNSALGVIENGTY